MNNIQSEKLIYRKPVDEILGKIENSKEKSILLIGDISTGKSLVLNELLNKESDKKYIDVSLKSEEYLIHPDQEVYELYHVCLIVKKMINAIKEKNSKEYFHFINLERLVHFYYTQINYMFVTDNYKNKYDKIDEYLLKNPETLLEEFISIISLDIKNIRLIIDDFDFVGYSSKRYQTYIYNMLKNYLSFIVTVSDRTVINNEERMFNLSKANDVILVDYSSKVEDVKKIIEINFQNEMRRFGNDNVITSINFLISDETILKMIEKTNGNLFDINVAISNLYSNLENLTKEQYDSYLLDYIDREINKSVLVSGKVQHQRILHIK